MDPTQFQQYLDMVGNALSQFITSMQMPVNKVWELMVKQNYVYAYQEAIFTILSLIFIISMIIYLFYWYSPTQKEESTSRKRSRYYLTYETSFVEIITIFGTIVSGVLILLLIALVVPDLVARFLNPEYMAAKDTIQLLQGINPLK